MPTLALPANMVRFYNDGPEVPLTGPLQLAEWNYRNGFFGGAREVVKWDMPDPDEIEEAWEARRKAREAAQLLVPSSVLFGDPGLDSEQIVYRVGHEVEASRTRGRCQALEMAKQLWWELGDVGMHDEQILQSIMMPWHDSVAIWALSKIDQRLVPPPRPEDFLTAEQRRMLDAHSKCPAKTPTTPKLVLGKMSAISRRLTNVEREQLEWLWPGRIPLGKLTLLAGDPGLGKSFVTLDIAARVSRGLPWPDLPLLKQPPAGVFVVQCRRRSGRYHCASIGQNERRRPEHRSGRGRVGDGKSPALLARM